MKVKFKEICTATQWFKVGDHPLIKKIPRKYKDFGPVVKGATGLFHDIDYPNVMTFVFPGNYLIESKKSCYIVNEQYFKEQFEIIKEDYEKKITELKI